MSFSVRFPSDGVVIATNLGLMSAIQCAVAHTAAGATVFNFEGAAVFRPVGVNQYEIWSPSMMVWIRCNSKGEAVPLEEEYEWSKESNVITDYGPTTVHEREQAEAEERAKLPPAVGRRPVEDHYAFMLSWPPLGHTLEVWHACVCRFEDGKGRRPLEDYVKLRNGLESGENHVPKHILEHAQGTALNRLTTDMRSKEGWASSPVKPAQQALSYEEFLAYTARDVEIRRRLMSGAYGLVGSRPVTTNFCNSCGAFTAGRLDDGRSCCSVKCAWKIDPNCKTNWRAK